MTFKYALTAFVILLLSGCGAERENDPIEATSDSLALAVEEAVLTKILPTVEAFSSDANTFKDDAETFCSNPQSGTLLTLQQQWKTLSAQWYQLMIYNFGPLNDDLIFPTINFIDSLRLRGTDYTETARTEISNNLAGTDLLNDSFFNSQTFQKVGLLPLQLLAFETAASEHSTGSSDIVSEYTNQPRKCDILEGLSRQIIKHASYVKDGWNTDHKDSGTPFKTIFINDELEDGTPALTKLITSVQEYLDYLQQRNVATTAAKVADYAWESIAASIDEIELLLEGTEDATVSFFALMTSAGYQNAVDTVRENIAQVRRDIASENAAALEVSLGTLDGNFKREVPDGLDITLGINFSDGD